MLGFGLLKGKVVRLKVEDEKGNKLKVLYMGWNCFFFYNEFLLLVEIEEGYVYFVYFYYIDGMEVDVFLVSVDYGV